MDSSERLSLPFISPGQAQKEIYHNEALQILDTLVAASVEQTPVDDPPASPGEGTCYLVGSAPTGDWAGNPGAIASYSSGGWRFVAPVEGTTVWVKSSSVSADYVDGGWQIGQLRGVQLLIGGIQVVGAQAGAVADPTGGATIDSEARAAVGSILAALRQHGLIAAI